MARGERRAPPVRLVLSWQDAQARRCGWCGRYLRYGAEAGYGHGLGFCEPCFRRREAVWAWPLGGARALVLTGAA